MPNGLRNCLFAVVYCMLAFAHVVYATTLFVAEITVDSLNVRDRPSIKGNIIGKLKKGEQVIASDTDPGWAITLFHGETPGYFSTEYMKIVKVISSEGSSTLDGDKEESKCNAESANLKLNILTIDFKCKEDLAGEGYKSCSAWFDVAINSDCNESMSVNVGCGAEFKYETKDGITPYQVSETGLETIYLSYGRGNGQIEVNWQSKVILEPVIRVQLNDGSCSIISTYGY